MTFTTIETKNNMALSNTPQTRSQLLRPIIKDVEWFYFYSNSFRLLKNSAFFVKVYFLKSKGLFSLSLISPKLRPTAYPTHSPYSLFHHTPSNHSFSHPSLLYLPSLSPSSSPFLLSLTQPTLTLSFSLCSHTSLHTLTHTPILFCIIIL